MTPSILGKLQRLIDRINALDLVNFLIISASGFLIFGNMITRTAIDAEALVNFRYMRESTILDNWTGETLPGHFTTYRPVMGTLLRLEYILFGFNPPVFFTINLVLLAILAGLIYLFVVRATKETIPGLVAALLFMTDWRLIPNIKVIGEVQITLAGIFGLLALWMLWFGKGKFKPVLIFLLLLMATLSKEFGLAFALVVFVDAILTKQPDRKKYFWIAIGVVLSYLGIRLLIGTMPTPARTYSSFLNQLKWWGFNVSSGFIFTFINLFRPESDGELPALKNLRYTNEEVWPIIILQIIPIIILFIIGFNDKEDRKYTTPLLFLIVGNSILMFWRYAFRFHFLGYLSMYILVGFGINKIISKWGDATQSRNVILMIFMGIGFIFLWRGENLHGDLEDIVRWTDQASCYQSGYSQWDISKCLLEKSICIPTDEYYQQENNSGYYSATDPETVRLVMDYYHLPIIDCTCLNPYPSCK